MKDVKVALRESKEQLMQMIMEGEDVAPSQLGKLSFSNDSGKVSGVTQSDGIPSTGAAYLD